MTVIQNGWPAGATALTLLTRDEMRDTRVLKRGDWLKPAREQFQIYYRVGSAPQQYVPDFVCFEKIVLEIKAVSQLNDEHRAQVHNALRATGHKLGLLVNFGHYPAVEYERIVV